MVVLAVQVVWDVMVTAKIALVNSINMAVLEALKESLNSTVAKNLYFFRNSNGLEIDLLEKQGESLSLFEIKSGKALDKKFIRNIKYSRMYYPDSQGNDVSDTVIYSGEDVPSFDGVSFVNYKKMASLFSSRKEKFRLEF